MTPARSLATVLLAGALLEAAPALATRPLKAQLCRGRVPCEIAKTYNASPTVKGVQVRIIELNLGKKNPEEGGRDCRPFRREFWRVVGPANRVGAIRLMILCNDGYGAAGVGEDSIAVSGNRLVHHQYGGSAWRWDVKRAISINPIRVLSRETCSFHNISPGFDLTRWDWMSFSGEQIMMFRPDKATDEMEMGCAPKQATHRFPLTPRLGGRAARGVAGGPALGSCALEVRADASRGFVVRGRPAAKGAGPRLRVLAIGKRTLLVTVDAKTFRAGRGWRDSDHVQVWQAGFMSLDPVMLRDKPMRMFAIRASDGKAFLGHGVTKARPDVEAHKVVKGPAGMTLQMRLTLPREVHSLTVAFGEAGKGGIARLTATSRLVAGNPLTLGATFDVPDGGAFCVVRNGRLDAVNAGHRFLLRKPSP